MKNLMAQASSTTDVNLTISANFNNYNLFTAASSPAGAVNVTLTINTGIFVNSVSTTSSFAAGSVLKLVNNGTLAGLTADAVTLGFNLTIDNTNGVIGSSSSGFKSVALNGFTATWIGGYNSSQVKAAVS